MKRKYQVYDSLGSRVIGKYKHLSSAKRKRNKELKDRNLPAYCILILK